MKKILGQFTPPEIGNSRLGLLLFLIFVLANPESRADGGIVHLRQTRGPFTVTVFTPPEIIAKQLTNVSVLIQGSNTGEAVLDAEVALELVPPHRILVTITPEFCGISSKGEPGTGLTTPANPSRIFATHTLASTKFLYGVPLVFPEPGDWKLLVSVHCRGEAVNIGDSLAVSAPSSHLSAPLPYLVLPLVIISLFLLNQWLRHRRSSNKATISPRYSDTAPTDLHPEGRPLLALR